MNVLDVADRERILNLLRRGWSIRHVARETGHRHETIRRYGIEAGVLTPRAGPKCTTPAEVPTDPKPHTEPEVPTGSTSTRSSAEPFREFIDGELAKRRNAKAIFQDLVLHRGYTGSYDAVKRLARKLRKREPKVSCRFETEPGQEAQVDYGEGAPARDPRTGKYRKPRLFVMTLGNSRHAFRKVVWKSSTEIWCKLHEEAFAYFGGATQTIRLDNLKEGVLKPDIYDPQLNPLYAKMLEHYGVVAAAVPAVRARPQRQSRIGGWLYAEDGAERQALRKHRGAERAPRALERTLRCDAHPWHHQAPSAGHVRGGAAVLAAAADDAL